MSIILLNYPLIYYLKGNFYKINNLLESLPTNHYTINRNDNKLTIDQIIFKDLPIYTE